MEYKKSMIIILAIFFVSIAGVCAGDANDTAIAGEDASSMEAAQSDEVSADDDGQAMEQLGDQEIISESDNGSFAALKDKIDNAPANSIIKLENDYDYANETKLTNGIPIEKPITIDGQGKTIDAKNKIRIFRIKSADVVLKNIIFVNSVCNGRHGGAIEWEGDYGLVFNCSFVNTTDKVGGGAVYWSGHYGAVSNCSFVNTSSKKGSGGAIEWEGDYGVVSNCSFVNGHAQYEGGAIYFKAKGGVVSNCSFVNNSAQKDGGAVYLGCEKGVVCNCSFVNITSKNGGGGAVYLVGEKGVVCNCSFVNITSKNDGGAVYLRGEKGVVCNCSFVNITSKNGGGGAVYLMGDYSVVSNCSFVNITSKNGGAVYFRGKNNVLSNCSFVNNNAESGGAVYLQGKNNVVSNCSFVNNSAKDDGGAVSCHADSCVLSNCSFVNNNANSGGAVSWCSHNSVVSNCSFVNNNAESGGAVSWQSNRCNISNCSFVNNNAGSGGAVYWCGKIGTLSECSFVNNNAGSGGAVSWQSNRGNISNCSFVNCSSKEEGGAIYWNGTKSTLSSSSFKYCSGSYGGAIYMNDTNSTVSECIFINNTADVAIIYFENVNEENLSYFKINNNVFLNNAGGYEISFNRIDNNSNADYNWFGNNATNYDAPPITGEGICDAWLFLDAAANPGRLAVLESSGIIFKLSLYNSASKSISDYNNAPFKNVNLTLAATNGNVSKNIAKLGETVEFTLTEYEKGSVTARVENAVQSVDIDVKGDFDLLQDLVNNNSLFVISLERNYTYNQFDMMSEGVVINRPVTINGNGFTVDAKGKSRIFNVQSDNVTITNITFANANTTGRGAAILCFNALNTCISGCSFVNNHASGEGGAIWVYQADVSGCSFVNNSAGYGAAIYLGAGHNNISGCVFINNTADFAIICNIEVIHDNAVVTNNIFLNNNVDALGMIYIYKGNSSTDYNWYGNTAVDYNGTVPSSTSKVWLFLNATANPDAIPVYGTSKIIYKLYSYNSTSHEISEYDHNLLYPFDLTVTAVNGNAVEKARPGDVIIYTATCGGTGSVTAAVENAAFTIDLENTRISANLTVEDQKEVYGEYVTLKINYDINATGIVSIVLKGKKSNYTFNDMDLNNVILLEAVNADEYDVTVVYSGDSSFINQIANATFTVTKITTSIVSQSVTTVYNMNKDLVITLKDGQGNVLRDAYVSVDLNGVKEYKTDKNGQIKIATGKLVPKTYAVKMRFMGNDNCIGSSRDVKVTVKKATPKMTAKNRKFKAKVKTKKYTVTLKSNVAKAMKKVKFTLKIAKKTFKAKTNAKGKATFKIKKLTKKGKYKAVIKYKGDKFYKKLTKKAKITIR